MGRVAEEEIRGLLQLPEAPRFKRAAPAKSYKAGPNSLEWKLLCSLLVDLPLIVHIDPSLLRTNDPEGKALLAIRDIFESEEDPSVRAIIDRLEGNPLLEHVLQASRYADELGFTEEQARAEMQGALGKLDEIRRKTELDNLLKTGLRSKQELASYNDKMIVYKRLQGALRQDAAVK